MLRFSCFFPVLIFVSTFAAGRVYASDDFVNISDVILLSEETLPIDEATDVESEPEMSRINTSPRTAVASNARNNIVTRNMISSNARNNIVTRNMISSNARNNIVTRNMISSNARNNMVTSNLITNSDTEELDELNSENTFSEVRNSVIRAIGKLFASSKSIPSVTLPQPIDKTKNNG